MLGIFILHHNHITVSPMPMRVLKSSRTPVSAQWGRTKLPSLGQGWICGIIWPIPPVSIFHWLGKWLVFSVVLVPCAMFPLLWFRFYPLVPSPKSGNIPFLPWVWPIPGEWWFPTISPLWLLYPTLSLLLSFWPLQLVPPTTNPAAVGPLDLLLYEICMRSLYKKTSYRLSRNYSVASCDLQHVHTSQKWVLHVKYSSWSCSWLTGKMFNFEAV